VKIETYSDKYFQDVINLIRNFHKESLGKHERVFDVNALMVSIANEDWNNAFLMIIDGKCEGILGGNETKLRFNDKRIFQEYVWYTNKKYAFNCFSFMSKVMDILKCRGISYIIMSLLETHNSDRLRMICEKKDFKLLETHYIRALNGGS